MSDLVTPLPKAFRIKARSMYWPVKVFLIGISALSLNSFSTSLLELMVSATLAPCVLNTHQTPPFPLGLSTSSDPTWNALRGWRHHFLRALPTCHLPMWSLMLKDTPALIFPRPYLLRQSFRISLTTECFIYTFLVHPLSP